MWKRRRKNQQSNKRVGPGWKDIVKENELMEKYYKMQQIIGDDEWDTFMKFCRKDLSSTFRITKIRGHAEDLLKSLKEGYISKISTEDIQKTSDKTTDEVETEQNLVLEPISWYPDELAWNSNLSRRFIRRSDVLQKLHRFLVEDSECGAITRQEAVSMIPPMLLDVQSHHIVLDVCAAPGSKTAQIVEMMHGSNQEFPTGTVIANDVDHKRCFMLTHQINRLNTPCVIVTNHDASVFPRLYVQTKHDIQNEPLSFDRVLCDVPCSGDGTLRKNPQMWHKWTPHLGIALHRLQIRILIRGLELLKVGGRLVYSTCSFNPIENEAVLATVLSKSESSVELVDCRNDIPGLKRNPGLLNWKVINKEGQEFKTFSNVPKESSIKESMFPPNEEVAKSLNLQHAMRVYPHMQNTGGFFIAVLHKKNELPWQKSKKLNHSKYLPWERQNDNDDEEIGSNAENPKPEVMEDVVLQDLEGDNSEITDNLETDGPAAKKVKQEKTKVDQYLFLNSTDKDLVDVRKFYDISDNLPSSQFLIRSTAVGKKKHIYLVSESTHQIMSKNKNLIIINTGVRVFTRSPLKAGFNEHGVEFRLVQDGLHLLQRFIRNRIIDITHQDLVALTTIGEPDMDELSKETQLVLSKLDMGCVVWRYRAADSIEFVSLSADIYMCGHHGRKNVQCMLSKEERKHFLRLLGIPIPEELQVKIKGASWGDKLRKDGNCGDTDGKTIVDEKGETDCDNTKRDNYDEE